MASFQPESDNTIYQENVNSGDDGTTLFLGDLSVYSTENHIRELFQPYGKIENVRIKRGNSTKPHLCYGFIKFDSRMAAEKALSALNGVMFLGRTLRVGWAEKKSQNPQQVPQQQQQQQYQQQRNGGNNMKGNTKGIETAQIHVSFISKQIDALISESTLRSLFSMYGEVIDVAIKKSQFDKKLKLQNGYGFVHYRLDEQGIQSAIQATNAIHQVTIDRVTYDCSLSHSLEVMIQQQGIQAPVHHGDSTAIDDQQHLGMGEEEEDVTHLPPESAFADLPEQPLSTVNLSTLQSAVAHNNDQGVTAAFPMLQAPAVDGGNGHYQIQNAQPDYQMRHEDFSTTLEFFPKFIQPDNYGGFPPPPPHLNPHAVPMPPPGAMTANPFHSLAYPAAPNPNYLNPSFHQLGMFYPPTGDFNTHLFPPPTMSPSPMNTSFYDDGKMAVAAAAAVAAQSTSFPLKHFEGLGGLSGIGLGAFDSTAAHGHTPTGLADYQAPFPTLHNFQTSSFETLRFPSLSSTGGVNEDLSHSSQPATNIHFNQQF